MQANHHTNARKERTENTQSSKGSIGVVAKKGLGQNFLMHQATADRIADAAGLTSASVVLEIGPGTGMLTRSLLERAGRVIAVEADAELIPTLTETFKEELKSKKLTLIQGDIRSFDWATLPKGYVVAANIPYYITGELIRTVLSAQNKPSSVTFLVQKEVAERVARDPKESLLSLAVKVYGEPKYAFTVPKGAFRPAPKVDSAVLSIRSITSPFATDAEEQRFFEVLRAGFAHKRKRLAKNLEEIASRESVNAVFQHHGLNADVRAEDVPLATWKKLTAEL